VKILTNSKCFVVAGVGAFHGFMFMKEVVFLWWIEIP